MAICGFYLREFPSLVFWHGYSERSTLTEGERADGRRKEEKKKSPWWYKLGILVFGAVFCVSAFMVGRDYLAAKKEADAFDSLSKLAAEYAEEKAPADLTESAGETTDQEKAAEWAELLKEAAGYAALKNENPDYVGWIRIPDTRIDYPVVDRESDPEYYLHRAFDGSKSFGGTPFLGEASGVDTKCLIIYGHNMKNGSIFGTLDSYKKADYWKEHPIVRFYVDGEPRTYEVFAAVETQVLYEDEDGFHHIVGAFGQHLHRPLPLQGIEHIEEAHPQGEGEKVHRVVLETAGDVFPRQLKEHRPRHLPAG